MTTCRALLYAKRFGNRVHYMFRFIIFLWLLLHWVLSNYFLNRLIRPIDGTLTCTCTPFQSEPGSNCNASLPLLHYTTLPQSPKLVPHYQMQFSTTPRTALWGMGILSLCKGYSQLFLRPANKGFALNSQKRKIIPFNWKYLDRKKIILKNFLVYVNKAKTGLRT